KLLRRITRTENILHRNFTRRQVAIQNRVASNIGISQSTFSVKVLNLFSRSRRKTNKRKSKHSAMLRNKEDRKSGSAGMPRPISYAVFCLKKKKSTYVIENKRKITTGYLAYKVISSSQQPCLIA